MTYGKKRTRIPIEFLGRVELVPKDTKIRRKQGVYELINGKPNFSIDFFKELLLSIKGITKDFEFILDKKRQRDCYYKCKIGKEFIRIELNYGIWEPYVKRISIVTQSRVPSRRTFLKFVKIVDQIVRKTSMKILNVNAEVISLDDLKASIALLNTPNYKKWRAFYLCTPYTTYI